MKKPLSFSLATVGRYPQFQKLPNSEIFNIINLLDEFLCLLRLSCNPPHDVVILSADRSVELTTMIHDVVHHHQR